jgi:hypothetical protein
MTAFPSTMKPLLTILLRRTSQLTNSSSKTILKCHWKSISDFQDPYPKNIENGDAIYQPLLDSQTTKGKEYFYGNLSKIWFEEN